MLLLPAVHGLGDRRFTVREKCHKLLASAGPLARPVLAWGQRSDDGETARRCWLLAAERRGLWAVERAARMLPCGWKRLPWLCFEGSNYQCGEYEWARLASGGVVGVDRTGDFPEWRAATRLWAAGRLRSGWSEAAVQQELERMASSEIAYRGDR